MTVRLSSIKVSPTCAPNNVAVVLAKSLEPNENVSLILVSAVSFLQPVNAQNMPDTNKAAMNTFGEEKLLKQLHNLFFMMVGIYFFGKKLRQREYMIVIKNLLRKMSKTQQGIITNVLPALCE